MTDVPIIAGSGSYVPLKELRRMQKLQHEICRLRKRMGISRCQHRRNTIKITGFIHEYYLSEHQLACLHGVYQTNYERCWRQKK